MSLKSDDDLPYKVGNWANYKIDKVYYFAIRVTNINAIAEVFGEQIAKRISELVHASMIEIFDGCYFDGSVRVRDIGAFDLSIGQNWLGAAQLDAAESVIQRLGRWFRDVSLTVHEAGDAQLVAAITLLKLDSTSARQGPQLALDGAHAKLVSNEKSLFQGDHWRPAYAKEMRLAVEWMQSLVAGELQLSWIPVRSLQNSREVAYFHGQLCAISSNGMLVDTARSIHAIRQLGFDPALDIETLSRALDLASRSAGPHILIDISASTINSSFWLISQMIDAINTDKITRLLIQIIPDCFIDEKCLSKCMKILRERGIGLGIIIYGSNQMYRNSMILIQPEFISISPMFARSILGRPETMEAVWTICALARVIAPMVVLQGIDTPLLAEHARRAGIVWGEGEYLGAPSWQTPREHISRS